MKFSQWNRIKVLVVLVFFLLWPYLPLLLLCSVLQAHWSSNCFSNRPVLSLSSSRLCGLVLGPDPQRLRTYSWLFLLRGLSWHCLGDLMWCWGSEDSCVKGSHEKRLNLRRLFSIFLLPIYHLFSTFKVFPFAVFSIWNFPFLKYYQGSLSLPSSINLNISFFINNSNILLQIKKIFHGLSNFVWTLKNNHLPIEYKLYVFCPSPPTASLVFF